MCVNLLLAREGTWSNIQSAMYLCECCQENLCESNIRTGLNSKAVAISKMWLAQLVAHVNNLLCMLTKTCNIQIVELVVALKS